MPVTKLIAGLLVSMGLGMSSLAVASEAGDFAVGVSGGGTNLAIGSSGNSTDYNPGFGHINLSYYIDDVLATEVRLGSGLGDDENVSVNEHFGLYFRGEQSLDENEIFRAFFLLGYTATYYDIQGSATGSGNSFSFGGGLGFTIAENSEFVLEANRVNMESSIDLDSYTFGFRQYFR